MNHQDFHHRLWALRQPRAETPTVTVDGPVATLRLYDPIDSWGGEFGLSAKELATALDELPDTVTELRLHINSPGGEVFEGIAVVNLLRSHEARVVAVVDGLAASAASFIAAACDEVVMARNSEMMIHDAWGLCVGNAQDMRDLGEDLDRLSDNIASVYAEKAGGTVEEWRAAMARETWYSAEEAVAAGLADRVDAKKPAAKSEFDLTIFTYAGRNSAPAPDETVTPTSAPAVDIRPEENADVSDATDLEAEDFELRGRALKLIAAAI